ncbi:MAG: prephenate dehydrogenase [Eubacteriales bacterium]|nr:prephenate dehydrogenase [Eubacteriales bacterium]MDD3199853.1 prephenate dehydrogenase [Eubacteriales bacterium]MDD4630115.1 prephenate dehydrogenase [Eubacteriales bacterium]
METEVDIMRIGIVGLGLIGGSIAKAFKQNTEHEILGTDLLESVICKAILLEAIDGRLTDDNTGQCDIIILALYPGATVEYLKNHQKDIKKGTIVMDCSGVKEAVCAEIQPIAAEREFKYVGGHPMAGIEFSGFGHSKRNLFKHASMILAPQSDMSIQDMELLKRLWLSLGFNHVQISTPEEHDKMIAFTSQLAHVVSSAYVKSPQALKHKGFSAGSYNDLSRVARLNETMWTELFMLNRKNLVEEIDGMIERLHEYRDAINDGKEKELCELLREGTERKIIIDG